MHPHPSLSRSACGLLVLLCFAPNSGLAFEYSAQPSVSLQNSYNDNIFLTTQPHESVSGSIIRPQLELAATLERLQVMATGSLRRVRYSGDTGLDSDDKFINLSSFFKQARNLWQVNGATSKESTLLSETFNPDLSIAQTQTRRTTRSIAPSWTTFLTEGTQFKLGYQSSDVSYNKEAATTFSNYQSQQASLTLSNQLSERTQIFLSGSYSDFKVPATEYSSKTNSWQLGLAHDFSETLKMTLSAGGRKTSSEQRCEFLTLILSQVCVPPASPATTFVLQNKDSGSVYNLDVQKQFERTRVSGVLSRGVDPSGSGTEIQTDTLSFTVTHDIAPATLNISFTASGYRSKAIGGNTANYQERDYYQLGPRISWRWTEYLSLDGSYRRVRLKYADSNDVPTASVALLSLSYRAPRYSISR